MIIKTDVNASQVEELILEKRRVKTGKGKSRPRRSHEGPEGE